MRMQIAAGRAIAAAIILSGCKPATTPTDAQPSNAALPVAVPSVSAKGLSPEEGISVTQGLIRLLSQFHDHDALGQFQVPCTNIYVLGVPKIVDADLNGTTGKIKIAVPVTAANPLAPPNVEPYFPTQYCYGAPPGGWLKGMVSTATYVVNVEKWNSGWQLSQQQNLVPGG